MHRRCGGGPSWVAGREQSLGRGLGLPEWDLRTRWHAYRGKWRTSFRNPCIIAPGKQQFRPSTRAGPDLRQQECLSLQVRSVPTGVRGHCNFEWIGRCDGGATAVVSLGRGRPKCGTAGSGDSFRKYPGRWGWIRRYSRLGWRRWP